MALDEWPEPLLEPALPPSPPRPEPAPPCVICTEDVAPEDAVVPDACAHVFHAACIARWSKVAGTCPTCRREFTEVRPAVQAPSPPTPPARAPRPRGARAPRQRRPERAHRAARPVWIRMHATGQWARSRPAAPPDKENAAPPSAPAAPAKPSPGAELRASMSRLEQLLQAARPAARDARADDGETPLWERLQRRLAQQH